MPVRYFLRSIIKYKSATTLYCTVASRPFPKYCTNSLYADFLPRHMMVINSALDSDSLIPDPDPAFKAEYRTRSRVLMTKNKDKSTVENIF